MIPLNIPRRQPVEPMCQPGELEVVLVAEPQLFHDPPRGQIELLLNLESLHQLSDHNPGAKRTASTASLFLGPGMTNIRPRRKPR